ncbi:desmoplakin [Alphabaculovirus altermyunipunctae]|uniref:Desmoplakin n=1 Tax=Mythimna unipuncta nucleopolyhedrovirus TaxID=447897 RepID=A0A346TPK6_9ABAC|nr:desmoplakin [Mythimna unipuncta nucleopolyhedrovirus]AXU41516.1 desmoplakin [Mythimna unipuncta nucleopolyhedrovirus]
MYSFNNGNPAAPARYKGTDINAATVQNLLRTINSMSKRTKRQSATDDTLSKIRSIIGLYRPNLINRTNLSVPELVIEALASPYGGAIGMPNQITHNFNYKYDYNTGAATAAMANAAQQPQPVLFDAFGQPLPPQPFVPPPAPVPQPADSVNNRQTPTSQPQPPPPNDTGNRNYIQLDEADLNELNTIIDRACAGINLSGMRDLISVLVKLSDRYFRNNALASALKRLYCLDSRFDDAQRCVNDMDDLLQCINKNTNRNYRDLSQICDIMTTLYEIAKNIYIRMFSISNELEFDTVNIVEMSSRLIRRVDEVQRFERAYRSIVMATRDLPNIIVEFPDQTLINSDFDLFHDQFIKFLTTRVIDPKFENYRYNYKEIDDLNNIIERQTNDIQDLKVKADRVGHFERERDQLNEVIERLRNDLDKCETQAANDRREVKRLMEILSDEKQIKLNNQKFLELHEKANEQNVRTLRELQRCEDTVREKNRTIRDLEAECDTRNYESDQNSLLQQQIAYLQNSLADSAATITVLTDKFNEYRNQYLQSIVNEQLLGYNDQLQKLSDMRNAIEQYKHEMERLQTLLRTQVNENRSLVEKVARSKAREIQLQTRLNESEHETAKCNELMEQTKRTMNLNKSRVASSRSDRVQTGSARSRYYNTRQRARQIRQQQRRRSIEDITESSSAASSESPMPLALVTVPQQMEIQQQSQTEANPPINFEWANLNVDSLVTEDLNIQINDTTNATSKTLTAVQVPMDNEPFYRYVQKYQILQEILTYRNAIVWVVYHTMYDIMYDRPSTGFSRLVRRLGFEQFINYVNRLYPDLQINVARNISLIRADYARQMSTPIIAESEQYKLAEEEVIRIKLHDVDMIE